MTNKYRAPGVECWQNTDAMIVCTACNPPCARGNAKRTRGMRMRQQKMPWWKCVVSASHVSWSVPGTLSKCRWCWGHSVECGHNISRHPGSKVVSLRSARWLWHWASGTWCPRVSIAAIRSSQTSHLQQRSWHYLVRIARLIVRGQNSWKSYDYFV